MRNHAPRGSSPRMRGTRRRKSRQAHRKRFIPAYAGNTINPSRGSIHSSVHPRVCGEHSLSGVSRSGNRGSSPRMRGTHMLISVPPYNRRFIPAYAGNTSKIGASRVSPSVHPRVCGEHRRFHSGVRDSPGSSPRMRGTRRGQRQRRTGHRFIPAYAGNTNPIPEFAVDLPVHPRVCGEHSAVVQVHDGRFGSSPRMRGTLRQPLPCRSRIRFIPAYAGNTTNAASCCRPVAVHPRVCGEHVTASRLFSASSGSSPRMRGTRVCLNWVNPSPRFIPAYAGNTEVYNVKGELAPVHPRVCGEHIDMARDQVRDRGSSPRMRGTPFVVRNEEGRQRFIPAYAGNTQQHTCNRLHRAVHPRVCGEHNPVPYPRIDLGGSSPRMRGTLKRQQFFGHLRRFIPAYAGNTRHPHRQASIQAVHPRVCGEHRGAFRDILAADGSSPRMRGTLAGWMRRPHVERFIPAYAGNTASWKLASLMVAVHPRVCGEHYL